MKNWLIKKLGGHTSQEFSKATDPLVAVESAVSDERWPYLMATAPKIVAKLKPFISTPSKKKSLSMETTLNKDFYNDLPSMVCVQLDDVFIPKFSHEEWFPKAWEEYREHVKTESMDTVKMPYAIFKKYIPEESPHQEKGNG